MTILATSDSTWSYDFWHLGKRYRRRFKTKRDAINAEAQKRMEFGNGSIRDEKITFSIAAQLFFEKHSKPNKRSWKDDLGKIKHLDEFFGDKKLIDFTPLDIQNLRNQLQSKGLSIATTNRYHAIAKAIFNKMKFWRRFQGYNPADGVKLKRENNAHIRFLSKDEVLKLDKHLENDVIYPFFIAGLHTGMRRAEICNVHWKDITFAIKDIFVSMSKSGIARHIPMNDTIFAFVKGLYEDGKNPEDRVFGDFDPDYVSHRFIKKCKEIGIENFRFHDLRHTFASYLVMEGVSIYSVSRWLGHSSVVTTEKFYAHLARDTKREEIQRLNKLSGKVDSDGVWTNYRQTFDFIQKL